MDGAVLILDRRIDALEERLNKRITGLEEDLNGVMRRLDNQTRLNRNLRDRVRTLKARVAELDGRE